MVMSVVEAQAHVGPNREGLYPELEGARVLITGLEAGHGVDIARAFAEAGCRLILQTARPEAELDIVLEMLAQSAQDLRVSSTPIPDQAAALQFAQEAVRAYGGLDAVVNLARLDDQGLEPDASVAEIEDRVVATLGRSFRITHVIANRMQVTWKEGLILNIVTQEAPDTPAAAELGRPLGLDAAELLESPHALVGTSHQIVDDLLARHEEYGFVRYVVSQSAMRELASVVSALAPPP